MPWNRQQGAQTGNNGMAVGPRLWRGVRQYAATRECGAVVGGKARRVPCCGPKMPGRRWKGEVCRAVECTVRCIGAVCLKPANSVAGSVASGTLSAGKAARGRRGGSGVRQLGRLGWGGARGAVRGVAGMGGNAAASCRGGVNARPQRCSPSSASQRGKRVRGKVHAGCGR